MDSGMAKKPAPPPNWEEGASPPLEKNALEMVSALALGSLLKYVSLFGTPYQSVQAENILQGLRPALEQQQNGATPAPVPNWLALRQHLYKISGDWLWRYACDNFRSAVAPKCSIEDVFLIAEALRVDQPVEYENDIIATANEEGFKMGYVSFSGYSFPGSAMLYTGEPQSEAIVAKEAL